MNKRQASRVLREFERRQSLPRVLIESAFPVQRSFLDDPARMKAALCTRRSGKSYGIGLSLFSSAVAYPGTSQLYVALTRESAKRIMHKDVLKAIARQHGIRAKFNETTLDVTLSNGSMIYLLGIDAKPDEKDKILGQKFKRAVVDECASFRQDLHALVYGIIKPALTDLEGDLSLVGTPGNLKNFFFDVTSGKAKGWSVHKWSAHDNPHVARQWQEEINELVLANPRVIETPLFRQHYYGEWTIDTSKLVYRYSPETNDMGAAPTHDGKRQVRYVMGIDLGYTDATAIVVGMFIEHDPTLYIVYAEKREGQIITQVADWITALRKRYDVSSFIVDNAAKQSVEELRQRYQLPLEAAEKAGKADAIAMMNSDILTGRVRIVMPACAPLADEWASLIWDDRAAPKLLEHPNCPNHLADASLYMWRSATNYSVTPAPKRIVRGTQEEIDEHTRKEDEELSREQSDIFDY